MAAKHDWKSWLSRACGIAFGVTTQLAFLVTVYFLFYFLRDGGSSQDGNWFFVDSLLALQFAVVHSILLLPSVKKSITRILPNELYATLFAAATCAGFVVDNGLLATGPQNFVECRRLENDVCNRRLLLLMGHAFLQLVAKWVWKSNRVGPNGCFGCAANRRLVAGLLTAGRIGGCGIPCT